MIEKKSQGYLHLGGGEYSLVWPTQGCVTGQGMVFGLLVLNRVYNLPNQDQRLLPNKKVCILSFALNSDLK